MADKPKTPKTGRYPPDPRTWRPPPAPAAMSMSASGGKRHFVKATACGQARRGHGVTSDWNEVNCEACLETAPFRRRRG